MALAAARETLGEQSEVRDIRFEHTLLLADDTVASSAATVARPGLLKFVVETHEEGARIRRASAVLHSLQNLEEPPAHDLDALRSNHEVQMAYLGT